MVCADDFLFALYNFVTNLLRDGATALYPAYSDLLWEKNTKTSFFFNITVISEALKKNNIKYYSCNLFHVFLG